MKIIKIAAPKDKIAKFKITDPILILFINQYENLVPWQKIDSQEDIIAYIQNTLIPQTKNLTDPNSETNNYAPPNTRENRLANTGKQKTFASWINVLENDYKNSPVFYYLILKSVVDSTSKTSNMPPPNAYKDLVKTLYDKIKTSKEIINIGKQYSSLVGEKMSEGSVDAEDGLGKWLMIHSKEDDPENFQKNVDKLTHYSLPNGWCTGYGMATDYLGRGRFWLYLDKKTNEAKVAMRFVDGKYGKKMEEMQGIFNGPPFSKYEPILKFLSKNNFDTSGRVSYRVDEMKMAKSYNDSIDNKTLSIDQLKQQVQNDPSNYAKLNDRNKKIEGILDIAKTSYLNSFKNKRITMSLIPDEAVTEEIIEEFNNQMKTIAQSTCDYWLLESQLNRITLKYIKREILVDIIKKNPRLYPKILNKKYRDDVELKKIATDYFIKAALNSSNENDWPLRDENYTNSATIRFLPDEFWDTVIPVKPNILLKPSVYKVPQEIIDDIGNIQMSTQTMQYIGDAIKSNPSLYQNIPQKLLEQLPLDIHVLVVKKDANIIKFVPESIKNQKEFSDEVEQILLEKEFSEIKKNSSYYLKASEKAKLNLKFDAYSAMIFLSPSLFEKTPEEYKRKLTRDQMKYLLLGAPCIMDFLPDESREDREYRESALTGIKQSSARTIFSLKESRFPKCMKEDAEFFNELKEIYKKLMKDIAYNNGADYDRALDGPLLKEINIEEKLTPQDRADILKGSLKYFTMVPESVKDEETFKQKAIELAISRYRHRINDIRMNPFGDNIILHVYNYYVEQRNDRSLHDQLVGNSDELVLEDSSIMAIIPDIIKKDMSPETVAKSYASEIQKKQSLGIYSNLPIKLQESETIQDAQIKLMSNLIDAYEDNIPIIIESGIRSPIRNKMFDMVIGKIKEKPPLYLKLPRVIRENTIFDGVGFAILSKILEKPSLSPSIFVDMFPERLYLKIPLATYLKIVKSNPKIENSFPTKILDHPNYISARKKYLPNIPLVRDVSNKPPKTSSGYGWYKIAIQSETIRTLYTRIP